MGIVGIDYGLTPTGFVTRTARDIMTQFQGDLQGAFGVSFDITVPSVAGSMCTAVASVAGELWEVTEQAAESNDRDAASGPALDGIGALTAVLREAATNSTVTGTATGTPDTLIEDGFQAATASTSAAFRPVPGTSVTIAALPAWAPATVYQLNARVTNVSRCYISIAAGTSASVGTGPTTQDPAIPDGTGTLVWKWMGDGTGAVDIPMLAVDAGIVIAVAGDMTVIKTPIGGLQNITNLTDAQPGTADEKDPDYRIRQIEELAGNGAGTAATIQALMIAAGAKACSVFMNLTDTTNSDGVPPHSVETLVEGLDDQTIIDILVSQVVTGIDTFGNTSGSGIDSEGTIVPTSFTRPSLIPVFVDVTLLMTATTYGGDAAVQAAIAAYGDSQQVIGKDAVPSSIGNAALPVIVNGSRVAGVAGVFKVVRTLAYTDVIGAGVAWAPTTAYSATVGARSVVTNDGGRSYICVQSGVSAASGGPTGTGTAIVDGSVLWWFLGNDIPVTPRQLATLDTSRTAIHSTAGTP